MNIYKLRVQEQEDQNVYDFATTLIQFSYESIKKSYKKGSPRRIEYKIFKQRIEIICDLRINGDYKQFTNSGLSCLDLEFLNIEELKWFYSCLETYIYDNKLDRIYKYKNCLIYFNEQISKL